MAYTTLSLEEKASVQLTGVTQTQQQYHKVYVDGKGTRWWKTTQTQRLAFHKEKPYVCFSWAKYDPRDIHGCHVYPAGTN